MSNARLVNMLAGLSLPQSRENHMFIGHSFKAGNDGWLLSGKYPTKIQICQKMAIL